MVFSENNIPLSSITKFTIVPDPANQSTAPPENIVVAKGSIATTDSVTTDATQQ